MQNIENEKWDESKVNGKLKTKMERATDPVLDKQKATNEQVRSGQLKPASGADLEPADLRTAALVLAVDRVATVALERGIWP